MRRDVGKRTPRALPASGAERTSPPAVVRALWSASSLAVRGSILSAMALSAIAKLLAVFVALALAGHELGRATTLGLITIAVISVGRLVSSHARASAECELQRTLTRALLDGDVLSDPTPQPLRAIFEIGFHARTLLTETMPELAGSAVAAVCVAPLLAVTLPWRAGVAGAVALVVVVIAMLTLGGVNGALQRRTWAAQEGVVERVSFAAQGRLELVARGAEDRAMESVEQAIDRYQSVARRGAWGSALLGRAPIAAGLLAVAVVIAVNGSYRAAVGGAIVGQALVLGACLPILLGLVLRASELVRLSSMVGPVLDVLATPPRPDVARVGVAPPALPATVEAHGVTFAYGEGAAEALRDVSFVWSPGEVLVVEGKNGAGKSTLLRLLLGLRAPGSGRITVGGVDMTTVDLAQLRRGVAYLPQRPYLGEPQSVVKSALRAFDDATTEAAMSAALERVGLTAALATRAVTPLDVPVGELSAGQRQRLALARLLLDEAAIYLLDEPDANLDRAGVALVAELVAELAAKGKMVAIAAHTTGLATIAGVHVSL